MNNEIELDIERDLASHCAYVDFCLQGALGKGRCSRLLRNQMVVYSANIRMGPPDQHDWFDPAAICDTIAVLEGRRKQDITKGPFPFTKGKLRGLEYKHFFQASFIAQNLLNETKRSGTDLLYRKLIQHHGSYDAVNGRPLTETDISLIADAYVTDQYEKRAGRRSKGARWGLTGEHLVFARAPGGNRYLFVAPHSTPEAEMAASVRACMDEFPELAAIATSLTPTSSS